MTKSLILQALGTAAVVASCAYLDHVNMSGPRHCSQHVDTVVGATPDGKAHLARIEQCYGSLGFLASGRIVETY